MNVVWLHLGNILYLSAYVVRDIFWLRILTVAGTLSLIRFYFDCSESPMWGPIGWCSLFTAVNLYQIGVLAMERRPVFLGEEELRIYKLVFSSLAPREFLKLIALAEHKRADESQEILRQHEPVRELVLISSGRGRVQVDGRTVAEVGPGQFVGEMGFLTQQNASASIVANLRVEYLAWPADRLRKLFKEDQQLHVKVQGILGVDLVEKLREEGYASAHPSKVMQSYVRENPNR